jgi:hypothetical protein
MAKVSVKPYLSPTLVLLAFDWPDGSQRKDFLGFAIRREPGFDGKPFSFLPNRLTFDGPVPSGEDVPSDKAPIQKFMWWDARIDVGGQRNFTYTVIPVTGADLSQVTDAAASVPVVCPSHIQDGIGTWFNRAVVSSQAFTKLLTSLGVSKPADVTPEKNLKLRTWLANGMETVVPQFIANSDSVAGAIYHLTDGLWIIPEMQESPAGKVDIVYDSHLLRDPITKEMKPSPNQTAVDTLTPRVTFHPRDKTQIMHNKFLAAPADEAASRVLAGSANFTTEGLTSQANLLHTFENAPELAQAYFTRQTFLRNNPSLTDTRAQAAGARLGQLVRHK